MGSDFKSLLIEYPNSVYDRRLFVSLIRDYFPTEIVLANSLISLMDLGIVDGIDSVEQIDTFFIGRYTKMLETTYGLKAEVAHIAVETWCQAYGCIKHIGTNRNHEIADNAIIINDREDICRTDSVISHLSGTSIDNLLRADIERIDLQLESIYKDDRCIIENEGDLYKISNPDEVKCIFIKGNIDNLSLNDFINLEELSFGINYICDLPSLAELKKLKKLKLNYTTWEEVSKLPLQNVERLSFTVNQEDVPCTLAFAKLKELDIWFQNNEDNYLLSCKNIDFSMMHEIQELRFHHTYGIDYSSIIMLQNLSYLYIEDEGLADISFISKLTRLEKLVLCGKITDIEPISHLSNLKYLDISRNVITDISSLSKLTKLEHLDARRNPIVVDFDRDSIEWSCVTEREEIQLAIERSVEHTLEDAVRFIRSIDKRPLDDIPNAFIRQKHEKERKRNIIERVKEEQQSHFESGLYHINPFSLRLNGTIYLPEYKKYYIEYAKKKYPYLKITNSMVESIENDSKKWVELYNGASNLVAIIKDNLILISVNVADGNGEVKLDIKNENYSIKGIVDNIKNYWNKFIDEDMSSHRIDVSINVVHKGETNGRDIENRIAILLLIPIAAVINGKTSIQNAMFIGDFKKSGDLKQITASVRDLNMAAQYGAKNVIAYGMKSSYLEEVYNDYNFRIIKCKTLEDVYNAFTGDEIKQMTFWDYIE